MVPVNLRVQLLGDANAAAPYVGYAKSYAGRVDTDRRTQGLLMVSRHTRVGDVQISVQATAECCYVRIEAGGCSGWYMDSGLVDVVNSAPLSPYRGDPGILHVGASLQTNYMWGDINPSKHTNKKTPTISAAEGDLVGAFTAKYKPVPVGGGIIPPVPLPAWATQAEVQAWVDAASLGDIDAWVDSQSNATLTAWRDARLGTIEALRQKKLAATKCPASLFHGKLRLWVQAIYGAKFSEADWAGKYKARSMLIAGDIHASLEIAIPTKANPDQKYLLSPDSTVLYTDDQYNYWLLEISTNHTQVTIRPMKLSVCGASARTYLLSNAGKALPREGKAKYEAVILQTATPDMTQTWNLPTGITAGDRGDAIFYGWKATWKGDKADIVLHILRQGATAADIWFDASHLALTISRDIVMVLAAGQTEADRWSVMGMDSGASRWMPTATVHTVWGPEYDAGYGPHLGVFNPMQVAGGGPPTPINSNAPMYCFYDINDVLQVVNYGQDITGAHTDITYPSQPQFYPLDGSQAVSLGGTGLGLAGTLMRPGSANSWEKRIYASRISGGFSMSAVDVSLDISVYAFSGIWINVLGLRTPNIVASSFGTAWAYTGTLQAATIGPIGASLLTYASYEGAGSYNGGDLFLGTGISSIVDPAPYVNPGASSEDVAGFNAAYNIHKTDIYGLSGLSAFAVHQHRVAFTYRFNNGTNVTETGASVMIIPYGDASAVYMGNAVIKDESIGAFASGINGDPMRNDPTAYGSSHIGAETDFVKYDIPSQPTAVTNTGLALSYWTVNGPLQVVGLSVDLSPKPRPGFPSKSDDAAVLGYFGPLLHLLFAPPSGGVTAWDSAGTVNRVSASTYKFVGYSGVVDADPAPFNSSNINTGTGWSGSILAPLPKNRMNINADMFWTISSANFGDMMGKTFVSGNYQVNPSMPSFKGFVGFA